MNPIEKNFEIQIKQHGITCKIEHPYSDIDVEELIEAFLNAAQGVSWTRKGIINYILENYNEEENE